MLPEDKSEPSFEVNIRARVARGSRLLLTMDVQDAQGQPIGRRMHVFEEGESEVEMLIQPGADDHEATTHVVRRALRNRMLSRLRQAAIFNRLKEALRSVSLQDRLLALAVGVYLLVRLIGLADFPVYFFTDEAVQTVLAGDLVRDGFRGPDDEFLPTYFKNVYQYNLSVSVYLQVLPSLLLPRSIEATRGVSVLVTVIAALAVGLSMRQVFRSPYPWAGVLILSMTPAWLLHSRTAFETALGVSFYAGFLYCYLRYRQGQAAWLYGAIVLAALSFYSYSPAQVVVVLSAVLLFLSDLRYHWQQRRTLAWGFGLVLILTMPYMRFQLNHPDETINHLRQLGSYWSSDLSLGEKLSRFGAEYVRGLSPAYWYFPNELDFTRHRFGQYGHLFWVLLPFSVFGLWLSLRRIRQAEYRTVVIALLAAPTGAAMAGLAVTRALFIVVPASLLAALGFSEGLAWLARRWKAWERAIGMAALALLVAVNGLMIADALVNGKVWFTNYGMEGIQYGARQVFPAAEEYLRQNPGTRIILSPTWANGTDIVMRFFFPENPPCELGNIDAFIHEKRDLTDNILFIMTPEEYERTLKSDRFQDIRVEQFLPFPDGRPGFYFVRLRYVEDIDQIIAREEAEQRTPDRATLQIDGEEVELIHSKLDIGQIRDIFDGNENSLMRTLVDNPLRLEMIFPAPRSLSGMIVRIGGIRSELTVRLIVSGAVEPVVFSRQEEEIPDIRNIEFQFGQVYQVERLVLELRNMNDGNKAHVHLWEVTLVK